MNQARRGPGQIVVDLCLVVLAAFLILTGLVVMEETQVFPPPPSRAGQGVAGGLLIAGGIGFVAFAALRGGNRQWRPLLRRLLGIAVVAAALLVVFGVLGAAAWGAFGAALLGLILSIGLLWAAVAVLRRS